MPWECRGRVSIRLGATVKCRGAAGSYLRPGCSAPLADQIPANDSEGGLSSIFEVFHEYPLEFEGYLLSRAKMPGAKESDPD
jgi:hypothetical protein